MTLGSKWFHLRGHLFYFLYVCSICACLVLSVSSSSWCLGRDAVCDCGTPWTFLLPFCFRLVRGKILKIFLCETRRPKPLTFGTYFYVVDFYRDCADCSPGSKMASPRGHLFYIDSYGENKSLLVWNQKAQAFDIWYVILSKPLCENSVLPN